MKFFTAILSIYFLGLSFVTCNDAVSHTDESDDITSYVVQANEHSDHHEIDLCSPFCSCQCCQANMNTISLFTDNIVLNDGYTKIFSHHDSVIQDVTDLLLQPPQV